MPEVKSWRDHKRGSLIMEITISEAEQIDFLSERIKDLLKDGAGNIFDVISEAVNRNINEEVKSCQEKKEP